MTPRSVYELGTQVRATGTFQVSSVATDPTTVTAIIRAPAGTETTLVFGADSALVKDSTGVYHVDIATNAAGRWLYRFEGTGAAEAAGERVFLVEESGA